MMTLNEAIAHAEWAVNNCEGKCKEDHRQLAEWLKELRERKSTDVALEDERNLLSERLGDYREALRYARAENAKLRELAHDMMVYIAYPYVCMRPEVLVERAREFGIEVE